MGVFVDAITKMKDSMFEQIKDADEGVYDIVKFEVPVEDLVRLHEEAIKFERENERLREALEKISTRKMSCYLSESHMNQDFIKIARQALELSK